MKKSIVALAVAAAAFSGVASAKVDIYSNNKLAVQVSGEANAHMVTAKSKLDRDYVPVNTNTARKSTLDPNVFVFGNLQIDAQYQISSSTSGFASFEFEGDGGKGDDGVRIDDAVVGFINDSAGKFSFGETGHALAVLEKTDITNEALYAGSASHPTESEGKGVRWQKTVGSVALSADAQTSGDSEDNFYGVSADWAVNEVFTIGAAYLDGGNKQYEQNGILSDKYKTNTYGVSASASFDNWYLAATVSQYNGMNKLETAGQTEHSINVGSDTDGMIYGLAAAYQMQDTRFYGTYALVTPDEVSDTNAKSDNDLNAFTLGFDQQLTQNVKVYAEYTNSDLDNVGSEDVFMMGGKFNF